VHYDPSSDDFLLTDYICKELFKLREECAEKLDLNPEILLSNSVLYSLCCKRPGSSEEMNKNLEEIGMSPKEIERF
jgi:ribonuclease D